MNTRVVRLLFGFLVAGALLLTGAAMTGFWSPWADSYVQGVDVSRHQGDVDWHALAATDIRFAYIKASEGGDYVDPMFKAHWKGAGEAGLKRGAYHFFTLCRSGALQAAQFIGVAPRDAELPPAVDLEHMGPCREGPQIENVPKEVDIYLDQVERVTGRRPILYTTRAFHDAHLKGAFADERFWVRSLFRWPQYRRTDWVIWQHHNKGARAGVKGPVDINSFRGDERALEAFASTTRPVS